MEIIRQTGGKNYTLNTQEQYNFILLILNLYYATIPDNDCVNKQPHLLDHAGS